jgi:hypothetical protein
MEDYVARACQIACLTQEQIERLHKAEDRCRYAIPNWNIQEMFALPEIKERLCLSDDPESQASHIRKIKSEIDVMRLTVTDHGFPTPANMDAMHSFDWQIFHQKESLPFMGSPGRGGGRKKSLAESV